MSPLHRLAREAGLQIDWKDAAGRRQRVSDRALAAVLERLGLPAGSEAAVKESRQRLREEEQSSSPPLITAELGKPLDLPADLSGDRARLTLESGDQRDLDLSGPLPAIDEPGYHRLETGSSSLTLAVAPRRCFGVDDAAPGRRIWGAAVQIPSLRDGRGEPFGDFGALSRFACSAASSGADAVAISPVHALFPADATRFSPYAPSTRLFLNVLLADPTRADAPATALGSGALIDWEKAIPERLERLRQAHRARSDRVREAVSSFRRELGMGLDLHATYDALHAHFFGTEHAGGWQAWPSGYHDPGGAAVARFAETHREDVDFYAYLQWLADQSLAAAQKSAKDSGMAIGLVADLAIGMDAGGSHAWSCRDALLNGLSVGAPPDELGPDGQDWGITTFSPRALRRTGFADFLGTIRAALRHAGGIRIDHAMGLRRLWVVPHGSPSTEGAYLAYPQQDMMRLLALESWRARGIVVGEDLGTVPSGFREEMDAHGMLGMRVLLFERSRSGGFKAPEKWATHAAAMTSTHDLPTAAGWWRGRDIDWTEKTGRTSPSGSVEADRAARAEDRARLWKAYRKSGAASGPQPSPDNGEAAADAAVAFVGSAPSLIAIVPAEDLLAVPEQPNLPGTTVEHPNWRRRLPGNAEDMLEQETVRGRVERLNRERGR